MTPGGCPSPWQSPKVLFTLLLVFLCGSAAGGLGMKYSVRAASKPVPEWKEGGREITLDRFKAELNLRPDQAAKIETELDDFMKYYQTLQAQIDEVRAQGKDRILAVLDDSQKERFNKMLSELQNRPQLR
jgi:hypothetical protein